MYDDEDVCMILEGVVSNVLQILHLSHHHRILSHPSSDGWNQTIIFKTSLSSLSYLYGCLRNKIEHSVIRLIL